MDIRRWRTVDIVVAAVIAVAFGVVFYAWAQVWNGIDKAFPGFPPAQGVINGVWFLPAVVGPLVIRKPGAGLFTEAVASIIEALLGTGWGLSVILYGVLQGVGGEMPFAATGYRSSKLPVALVGGLLAGAAGGLIDLVVYYPDYSIGWKLAQVGIEAGSGMVIAGLGGWALTRGLAQTGVLDRFPSGRERAAV